MVLFHLGCQEAQNNILYLFKSYLLCHLVVSYSLRLNGLQHARLPSPSPSPRVCSYSCPLSWWCHSAVSSSVIPFSSCLQYFPAWGSFPILWPPDVKFFTWCEEVIHWKRPRCWKRLKTGGEGDNRGWDGWMASPIQWTRIWVNCWSWWWTGRPGVLRFMGLQRVGHE